MTVLGDRLLAIHRALDNAKLPHAFGGAIALAYCAEEPRGTRDLDVNLFVPPSRAGEALDALPREIAVPAAKRSAVSRQGQVRLMWADTPIDLFFNTHAFFADVERQVRVVPFEGAAIPVLGCVSLAVFKVMYNRGRDWGDIETMLDAAAVDPEAVLEAAEALLGAKDAAVTRLARTIRTWRTGS